LQIYKGKELQIGKPYDGALATILHEIDIPTIDAGVATNAFR
jgi:hypothetical protein